MKGTLTPIVIQIGGEFSGVDVNIYVENKGLHLTGLRIITAYAERLGILVSPLYTISSALHDSCGVYCDDSQEGQRQSTCPIVLSSITGNDNKVLGHSIEHVRCQAATSALRLLPKLLFFHFELSIHEMVSPWKCLHQHQQSYKPSNASVVSDLHLIYV